MNLYALKFRHYSQKDSIEGIITYLTAESLEDIYEWMKSEPVIDSHYISNSYQDNENDGKTFDRYDSYDNAVMTETFKERMIRLNGEMFDNDIYVSDTYYGVTQYGWELVKENVYYTDVVAVKSSLNINIVDINL